MDGRHRRQPIHPAGWPARRSWSSRPCRWPGRCCCPGAGGRVAPSEPCGGHAQGGGPVRRASAGARLWAADMDVEEAAVRLVALSAEEPALCDPVPAVGTATLGALREWCVRAAALAPPFAAAADGGVADADMGDVSDGGDSDGIGSAEGAQAGVVLTRARQAAGRPAAGTIGKTSAASAKCRGAVARATEPAAGAAPKRRQAVGRRLVADPTACCVCKQAYAPKWGR
eukprot:60631-Chlamydomonas_euryale.AAC.1